MHSCGVGAISSLHVYLLISLFISYGIYTIYYLEVDPEEFAVGHRQRINSTAVIFFNFITQSHILEKLLPWLSRLKEADARIPGVGKFYRAYWKFPIIGETATVYLMVTDYQFPKLLALESEDQLIRQRVEIRINLYHERTILDITFYSRRTSALFHYTVGRGLQYFFKKELESAVTVVTEIHRTLEEKITFSSIGTS